MSKTTYTWREVREIAKANGINPKLKRAALLQALADIGHNIGLDQITDAVTALFSEAFEKLKGIFRGGIWVHFYLDDNGRVKVRISLGEHGPAIIRRDLSPAEAAPVIEAINAGNFAALAAHDYRKRSRVDRLIIERVKSIEA